MSNDLSFFNPIISFKTFNSKNISKLSRSNKIIMFQIFFKVYAFKEYSPKFYNSFFFNFINLSITPFL